MPSRIEMCGKRFGRLVVLNESHHKQSGIYWDCICDCGNMKVIRGTSLRAGETMSCGCLNKEIVTKHGLHGAQTYNSWEGILDRCINPNRENYSNYGGRGIIIYKRWLKFKNFFEDMGERPKGLTIERIDNEKGYYKENCKWATPNEQQHNRRICKHNKTGTTGIHWSKQVQKYRAYINAYGKRYYLGYFNFLKDAIVARQRGEEKYWSKTCS